jgi:hypothetical protein
MQKNLLLGLLIVSILAIGMYIGRMNPRTITSNNTQSETMLPPVQKDTNASSTASSTPPQSIGTSIASHMTDDQKQMMRALGIDIEKLTPAMITCAETNLGTDRFESIKNGSTPSLTEKLELVACYK